MILPRHTFFSSASMPIMPLILKRDFPRFSPILIPELSSGEQEVSIILSGFLTIREAAKNTMKNLQKLALVRNTLSLCHSLNYFTSRPLAAA